MLPEHQKEVTEITSEILSLGRDIIEIHKESLKAFKNSDSKKLGEIKELAETKDIDSKANKIDNSIVKALALFEPEASELRSLVAMLKITNEYMRILNTAKKYSNKMKVSFENSEFNIAPIKDYITQIHIAAINSFEYAVSLVEAQDEEFDNLYRKIKIEESKTDDLLQLIEKEITSNSQSEFIFEYISISTVTRKLERVADHSVNIANLIYFAKKGGKLSSF